jgi:transcriptional regulator with XRE-family HTH domain
MTPVEFKAWRERMGWSQAQAAAALSVDLRNLQRREAGDVKISRETELACWALEFGQKMPHEDNVIYAGLFDAEAAKDRAARGRRLVSPRGDVRVGNRWFAVLVDDQIKPDTQARLESWSYTPSDSTFRGVDYYRGIICQGKQDVTVGPPFQYRELAYSWIEDQFSDSGAVTLAPLKTSESLHE